MQGAGCHRVGRVSRQRQPLRASLSVYNTAQLHLVVITHFFFSVAYPHLAFFPPRTRRESAFRDQVLMRVLR